MVDKVCEFCSAKFSCGDHELDRCWCNAYPPIFEVKESCSCMCPSCFKLALLNRINEFVIHYKNDSSIMTQLKNLPKTKVLLQDIDYYIEDSNYVFTAWHHLKRGHCCGNGCRHCPYSS